jgi:1,4-alpha-glucan branching enzyme
MPSRYEPFGLMALEAMACGLPVLVSPRDGLDELVEAGRTGLKIQWGGVEESADNLAYQVNTIIENRDLGKFLGKNARASAVRFDINRITERLVEIYRNVC